MRVAVIGIGNLIASDDGVGIRAVREFGQTHADKRVTCVESERGGLELLDLMRGFDAAVIVDAAQTGAVPPGSVVTTVVRQPFAPGSHRSLHTMELDSVLAFGFHMGMPLPDQVTVLAVEAADIETFHEGLTPQVQSAFPGVVTRLRNEVLRIVSENCEIQETA